MKVRMTKTNQKDMVKNKILHGEIVEEDMGLLFKNIFKNMETRILSGHWGWGEEGKGWF